MNEAREKLAFDVFLSHNSKDKSAVRALVALLTEHSIKVWLDEEQLVPGRKWQPLMEEGIRLSRTGAVLIGADGFGPWQDAEMQVFLQSAVTQNKPVIPVLLPGAPDKPQLPAFLVLHTWVDLRGGFEEERIDELIWGITGEHPDRRPTPVPRSKPVISVTRLRHGAEHLVGREKELARLDAAWHDPRTHIVTIVAWGGVGKTALVVEWMARMARDGWSGAQRVFDWSFYSQGTRERGAPSADAFIAGALEFFGGDEGRRLAASPAAPWDKGARLAQFVAQRRTLVVLDGVEPLQHSPGSMGGKLKDPALEALLKGLAQQNPGLCVVTTREPVENLAPFRNATSPQWSLEHLSIDAGANLLFQIGVRRAGSAQIRADDRELKDAARDVGGHALTLQLLGRYIAKAHNGDIRKRDLVRFANADAKIQGGHAFKVMAAYERWLAEGGEDSPRQLAVLRLLGLFDRPADAGCLTALRREPDIAGLTEPLVNLSDDDWNCTLSNLVECGLISCHENESQIPNRQLQIDCHPLIREYFAKKLSEGNPDTWRAAHRRLYEYLRDNTADLPHPTLDDLQPLYQAVAHGCQAGSYQDAFEEVYSPRIQRGDDSYAYNELGAFGSCLGVLSYFLEQTRDCVQCTIPTSVQSKILFEIAECSRAVGRLTDADPPARQSLHLSRSEKRWDQASQSARFLAALKLAQGRIITALKYAQEAVDLASDSSSLHRRIEAHVTRGATLHQFGEGDSALTELYAARDLLADKQPELGNYERTLRPWQEFRLHDALLSEAEVAAWQVFMNGRSTTNRLSDIVGRCWEALRQSALTLHSMHDVPYPLYVGYCGLIGGRAAICIDLLDGDLLGAEQDCDRLALVAAQRRTDADVANFRQGGRQDNLALGLVTRAWRRHLEKSVDGSQGDLDEAREIAERGCMKLFLADIYLYRARLFRDKAALTEARKLIRQYGYHRRDEELADAEEAAKNW